MDDTRSSRSYNWQMIGDTDELFQYARERHGDKLWSIARDGHEILFRVATPEETLRDRIKAWSDLDRRQSWRFNSLAEITLLVETHPELWEILPTDLRSKIDRPE